MIRACMRFWGNNVVAKIESKTAQAGTFAMHRRGGRRRGLVLNMPLR